MGLMVVIRLLLVLSVACLSACVSPATQPPALPGNAIAEARAEALRAAAQTAMARRARVYDLTWPVLKANTELCPKSRKSIGLVYADLKTRAAMSAGMRVQEIKELGFEPGVTVIHPIAGSPAGEAALPPGAHIRAVDGQTVKTMRDVKDGIASAMDKGADVTLTLRARGAEQVTTHTLKGVDVCDIAVKVSVDQALNAHAAKGDIVIYTGLIRALSDPALQFVIAHEAAHVAERHPQKYWRNLWASGVVVVGPPVFLASAITDSVLETVGAGPDISLQRRALAAMVPWAKEFEAEADYLGLYFFARAGGDLSFARTAFDLFSIEHPSSIYAPGTHPKTPERIVAVQRAINEIEAKRAAGDPLVPMRRR